MTDFDREAYSNGEVHSNSGKPLMTPVPLPDELPDMDGKIMRHLQAVGPITPEQAFNLFGCKSLSGVISRLRYRDYEITTRRMRDEDGNPYPKYILSSWQRQQRAEQSDEVPEDVPLFDDPPDQPSTAISSLDNDGIPDLEQIPELVPELAVANERRLQSGPEPELVLPVTPAPTAAEQPVVQPASAQEHRDNVAVITVRPGQNGLEIQVMPFNSDSGDDRYYVLSKAQVRYLYVNMELFMGDN